MNRIIVLAFLILIISCNTGNDIPKGILPPEKMQFIMWDMLQADGLAANSFDSLMRKPTKRMELYSAVLATHKISQDAFRKNIQFYESRPDLLKIVLDSLQQMSQRDTATIIVKEKKIIQDSLKRDTAKPRTDTVKVRKPPIEKIKALKRIVKPL